MDSKICAVILLIWRPLVVLEYMNTIAKHVLCDFSIIRRITVMHDSLEITSCKLKIHKYILSFKCIDVAASVIGI